jgi:hypothetical protein
VPEVGAGGTGVTADVTVSTVSDSSALDTKPDARQNPPDQSKEDQGKQDKQDDKK